MQSVKKRWVASLIMDALRLAALHRGKLQTLDARRVWIRGWDQDGLPSHQLRLHAGDGEQFIITVSKSRGYGKQSAQRHEP